MSVIIFSKVSAARQVCHILRRNELFSQHITITNIAKLYGINKKYAGRVFKNNTGMTFNEYLNTRRINAAKNLLTTTKMTVIDISLEVGYNNISYFNRVFKNLTGYTPNEYRSKNSDE